MNDKKSRLARKLHLKDSIIIGLASMIGAGIFSAVGPATSIAGTGMLIGTLLAAFIAYLNANSVAKLAALYPESGGAYVYGRNRLGPFYGYLAGWGFVIGKTASCAAMAMTFSYYLFPAYAKVFAIIAVITLTAVNYFGIQKTALLTRFILSIVLLSLTGIVFSTLSSPTLDSTNLTGWTLRGGYTGILESAGLMFFAFAGYARIATLGEEVIEPEKNIPKAIFIALSLTLTIYLLVIIPMFLTVKIDDLVNSNAPLLLTVNSGAYPFLKPLITIGACFGSLGVLLSLIAGISRTVFSMSANKDLPSFLNKVHPKYKVPHRADILIGALIVLIVGIADLRSAIGFSSFAILTYYSIANLSAWTIHKSWLSMLGFLSCILIAFNLPSVSVVGGLILFSIGILFYIIKSSFRHN